MVDAPVQLVVGVAARLRSERILKLSAKLALDIAFINNTRIFIHF